jgi:hypothetical protein
VTKLRTIVSLAAALAAAGAAADQRVGAGSGRSSVTPPVTKDSGVARERAERPDVDPLIEPRHGLLGAPGAALDSAGPSRLGAPRDRTGSAFEMPGAWRSGDLVRSRSSADVRAARQQQAPDLEWASARDATAPPAQPQRRSGQEKQGARGRTR